MFAQTDVNRDALDKTAHMLVNVSMEQVVIIYSAFAIVNPALWVKSVLINVHQDHME